jgi:Domain of unknown function (DUF4132)
MRLLRRRGLSREQEALLAEHERRGRPWVGPLTRDLSLLERSAWEAAIAEGGRTIPLSPWKTETGERLLGEPPEVPVSVVVAAVAGRNTDLALALVRRKLAWTGKDVALLFALAAERPQKRPPRIPRDASDDFVTATVLFLASRQRIPGIWATEEALRVALAAAEKLASEEWTDELRAVAEEMRTAVEKDSTPGYEAHRTRLLVRFRKLLGDDTAELDVGVVSTDDQLGKPLRKALSAGWSDDTHAGTLLLHLTQAASGTTPSQKWRARAKELVAETRGGEELLRTILAAARRAKDGTQRAWGDFLVHQWLADENAVLVRGAVWAVAAIEADWAVPALADLGDHAASPFEAGHDPRSIKVANACIRQLGELGTEDAVAALARMKATIKHKTIGKQIERALEEAAVAAGITKGQLLERQVPTFGLDADGRKEAPLGAATALVERDSLAWLSRGKPVKSVPKSVKEDHTAELRALRDEQKEIKKALAAERVRVEGLFAEDRAWELEEWRKLYLDHPLTGAFARRLIWRFGADAAIASGDAFTRADGSALEPSGEVRLWHPIDAAAEEVAAWRRFLLERELAQPFKQAFREVYFVAPAELETATYSNRFAAHILKYRQAYALVKTRGWSIVALGPYDNDGGRQWRDFEEHGIRAAFWMDYVDEGSEEDDMIAGLAATDQVRFEPIGGGDPIPIADVPPRVFSEAMRDVDLFVGVASIAADPQWVDQGDRHLGYWREYSFGELSVSAETRRDVLRELVPQLKIADRLELEKRYLRVRGDLRTYRIHLGSANILMEPNDEYLCIVPERGKRLRDVFLPFEDDSRLSVILSKAFLLADDRKITDETILSQIRR